MRIKSLTYCSFALCLLILSASLSIPLPIPITLQTLIISMIGFSFSKKHILLIIFAYLILGACGLPVFASFNGGLAYLLGPTGGFLMSYPLMALILHSFKKTPTLALLLSYGLCYSMGTIYFMFLTHHSLIHSLSLCVFPFLFGDILKILIALKCRPHINKYFLPK